MNFMKSFSERSSPQRYKITVEIVAKNLEKFTKHTKTGLPAKSSKSTSFESNILKAFSKLPILNYLLFAGFMVSHEPTTSQRTPYTKSRFY